MINLNPYNILQNHKINHKKLKENCLISKILFNGSLKKESKKVIPKEY